MNQSPGSNHWLELRLEGTKSNRDAIGARIKIVTKSGAQYNHVTTSVGYASSSAGPVHFGLGRDAAGGPGGGLRLLLAVRYRAGTKEICRAIDS